jgi:hypothetical protein
MKRLQSFGLGALIALAAGCSFHPYTTVLSPVGPQPLAHASTKSDGTLVVFSAQDFGAPGDDLGRYRSGYNLHSEDGKRLKHISNRAGSRGEDPSKVNLPPGRYKVVARAAAFGTVSVEVVLEAGKTTFVHLDGSELAGTSSLSNANFVSLPDGLIIGWRAKDDSEQP